MAKQTMTIGVNVEPIKSVIRDSLSDFRVMIEDQQIENENLHDKFEELKGIVLDMYNVVSYMAEHWER